MVVRCVALGEGACSVAALRGDVAAVDKFAMTLIEYAEKRGHDPWRNFGSYLSGWVLMSRGELERIRFAAARSRASAGRGNGFAASKHDVGGCLFL